MEGWLLYVVVAAVVVLVTSWLFRSSSGGKPAGTSKPTAVGSGNAVSAKPATKEVKYYTPEEVAKHATSEDCWLIIEGKVYDVTKYVNEHPGGDAIMNNAGADATSGFLGEQHPIERVREMIEEFYVGELRKA